MQKRQKGYIVATELLMFAAILVVGLVVGWSTLRDSINAELVDTANAVESSITLYYFQDPDRGAGTLFTPETFSFRPLDFDETETF